VACERRDNKEASCCETAYDKWQQEQVLTAKYTTKYSLMSTKLRPQPTRAISHRIFTVRWEKIYFGRSTPSNAYIFTYIPEKLVKLNK
jgi:hypothetical protein